MSPGDAGKRIQAWRRERGISSRLALEERIDRLRRAGHDIEQLSEFAIRDIERGDSSGSPGSLRSIAVALGFESISQLLAHDPPGPSPVPPRGANTDLSIKDCQKDFFAWDAGLDAGAPLKLDTIAIDMADGIHQFQAALYHTRGNQLALRMLVITDIPEAISGHLTTRLNVASWCKSVPIWLADVGRELATYRGSKSIAVQVRRYAQVPALHGLKASRGDNTRWYCGTCNLTPDQSPDHPWDKYRIVSEDDPDPAARRCAAEYDEHFNKLWAATDKFEIDWRWTPQG